MRVLCVVMLLLGTSSLIWAQNEPCLASADSPGCGIKITMNPPLKTEEKILFVPNEITVEVPLRLHAMKVQLSSKAGEAEAAEQFKPLLETTHYKKADGVERFQLQLQNCPAADSTFQVVISSLKFPYPFPADLGTLACKQSGAK